MKNIVLYLAVKSELQLASRATNQKCNSESLVELVVCGYKLMCGMQKRDRFAVALTMYVDRFKQWSPEDIS